MALNPPSVQELGTFRGEQFAASGDENQHAMVVLQQATDALWIYTGLDTYPTDARQARIFKNAILELTLWLLSQYEHRDEINSPFASERIGSYSYSKMQQAASGSGSGLWWLDMLFKMLSGGSDAGVFSVSSERVFNPTGATFEEQEREDRLRLHDPSDSDLFFGGGA